MHSLTRDRSGRSKSGQREIDWAISTHLLVTAEGGRDESGYGKKVTETGTLTFWRPLREEQLRKRKQSDRASATHFLETTEGRPCQQTEETPLIEGHSRSKHQRERDKSVHGKEMTQQRTPTLWRL